jgi:hypothetical protein
MSYPQGGISTDSVYLGWVISQNINQSFEQKWLNFHVSNSDTLRRLREWMNRSSSSNLPSVYFLSTSWCRFYWLSKKVRLDRGLGIVAACLLKALKQRPCFPDNLVCQYGLWFCKWAAHTCEEEECFVVFCLKQKCLWWCQNQNGPMLYCLWKETVGNCSSYSPGFLEPFLISTTFVHILIWTACHFIRTTFLWYETLSDGWQSLKLSWRCYSQRFKW